MSEAEYAKVSELIREIDLLSLRLQDLRNETKTQFDRLNEILDKRFSRTDVNDDVIRADFNHQIEEMEKHNNTYRSVVADRLNAMNTFLPRAEWLTAEDNLYRAINPVAQKLENVEGRAWVIGIIISSIPTILTLALHFVR